MQVIQTIADMRHIVHVAKSSGKKVGLVPTMGYLHEGHRTLMRQARSECDFVVASIFVNPTQFGPNEDFGTYPRDLERDMALCGTVPVDVVFHPDVNEMYPQPFLTSVRVRDITGTLCGASRPGHFEGVATVVTKLLNIVRPDVAYFGQKDAQQVAVIRQMAADLNMDDIVIQAVPIVREPDGLAMSSRNVYLNPAERQAALVLSRTLRFAAERVATGERAMESLLKEMLERIQAEPLADIDYVSIVDPQTLEPVSHLSDKALVALAVRFGRTRLIDNCLLEL